MTDNDTPNIRPITPTEQMMVKLGSAFLIGDVANEIKAVLKSIVKDVKLDVVPTLTIEEPPFALAGFSYMKVTFVNGKTYQQPLYANEPYQDYLPATLDVEGIGSFMEMLKSHWDTHYKVDIDKGGAE